MFLLKLCGMTHPLEIILEQSFHRATDTSQSIAMAKGLQGWILSLLLSLGNLIARRFFFFFMSATVVFRTVASVKVASTWGHTYTLQTTILPPGAAEEWCHLSAWPVFLLKHNGPNSLALYPLSCPCLVSSSYSSAYSFLLIHCRAKLASCCDAAQTFVVSQNNTPLGTNMSYEVETKRQIPIRENIFKMFPVVSKAGLWL